jgi:hypothetical protein
MVDALDLDSSSYWITDLTSIHEPESLLVQHGVSM